MARDNRSVGPLKITDTAYNKRNLKMRAEHKKETGKTLGEQLTSGVDPRRVSFACRFAGMAGSMKNKKGEDTPYAKALKKWGFSNRSEASAFCKKHKKS